MEKYKDIYNQFYNSDPAFKSNFQDLKSFNDYVQEDDDVVNELKEVYNFGEAPVQAPIQAELEVKKKEESIFPSESSGSLSTSPLASDTEPPKGSKKSLFGSRSKKRALVEIPEVSLDLNPNAISDEFEGLEERKSTMTTITNVGEMSATFLTAGLINIKENFKNAAGYYGYGDALFEDDRSYADIQIGEITDEQAKVETQLRSVFKRQLTGVTTNDGEGLTNNLINKFTVDYDENGQEISRVPEYNEELLKTLVKGERMNVIGLGSEEVEYNLEVDEDKLEEFAAKSYNDSQKVFSAENPRTWENVKNTRTGEIYKNVLREEITQGVEQIKIGEEIDKVFIQEYGFTSEELPDQIRKQAGLVQTNIINQARAKLNEEGEDISAPILENFLVIKEEIDAYRGKFKEKYLSLFDAKKEKYILQTQQQVDEFNVDFEALSDFIADKNSTLAQLKAEGSDLIKASVKSAQSEVTQQLKAQEDKLFGAQGKYTQSAFKASVNKGVANYYAKKDMEAKYAGDKLSYIDLLKGIMAKSSYESIAGIGILLEQYGGGKSDVSSWFTNLGNYRNEYEFSQLNPSVLKTVELPDGTKRDESLGEFFERITSNDGLGGFLKDMSLVSAKSALPSAPIIFGGMLMRGAGASNFTVVGSAALASFTHDTSMQLTEQYDAVYKKTGSVVLAAEGSRRQLASQLDLFYTYIVDAGILFGKARISGLRDFTKVGIAKFVGDVASESVLQEGPQNYFTEKITHEISTKTPFQGKLTDFIDTRTVLDVAAGSGPLTATFHTLEGLGALRAEKIKTQTLEALNQKGLAAMVLSVNKQLGKKAALALGYTMRLQGTLSKEEYENYVKTINRINEYGEVASKNNLAEERVLAVTEKMFAKNQLQGEQEAAETQEKKDMIAEQIKKIDTQINDLQDSTKEAKLSTIVDFKTGNVIYATDDQSMAEELKNNKSLAKSLFAGLSEGVYILKTADEKLKTFVDQAIDYKSRLFDFMTKTQELRAQYTKEADKASKDRLAGKKNTPTDAELDTQYQAELQNAASKFGMSGDFSTASVKAKQKQKSQTTRAVSDVVTEPEQFSIPETIGTEQMFDADESVILDAFIEANKQNPIALNLLNNIKTQAVTFKQMFPEGKIFYHTNKVSYTTAYNKASRSNILNETSDGFFAETENGEIHINLSDPSKVGNQDVVAHEIFHGVLLKAFGKKVFDDQGKFLKYVTDTQAIIDIKTAIESLTGRYDAYLGMFLGTRDYQQAEEAEEFLVQLGALLSRADMNSPLQQGFVGRVLAAISNFVKTKTGIDVFALYRNQSDAIQFFNYIGSQLKVGGVIDEKKFQPVQGGFMIPRNLDSEALSKGNLETGTVVAVHKSSDNLNPLLNQFTKRPGTSKLALDLPVKTLEEAIAAHNGAVLLIMSDNTGFFVDETTGEFVMGGYGYMAAKDNIEAGVGFASVNASTVGSTMTNAMASNEGNPVLALVVLSSPTAALGNYYALQYTFGSLPNFLTTEKQSNEFKNSMINVMRNKLGILDAFETDSKLIQQRIAANKLKNTTLVNKLSEQSRTNFDNNFLPFFNSVDFSNPESTQNFIKEFTKGRFSFPQRQGLVDTILPSHESIRQNVSTPMVSKILKENGLNQINFFNRYGEPQFVGDKLTLAGADVKAPWGSVFGGFTINPKADPLLIQDKGLTHPQFNAKVPGYDHFLLDGEYGVNQNFYTALQFGNPLKNPIDQMATQGIQPGTRLPASNKNPNSLTSKERRDILLDRPMVKRSMEAYQEERGAMESLTEQFAKRLGVDYSFYFDKNDKRVWNRDQSGNVQINTAYAAINTPIYGFSGIFLEMLMGENIVEYNKLVKSLLMDNTESSKAFRVNLERALQNATLKVIEEKNSYGIYTPEDFKQMNERVKAEVTVDAFRKIKMGEPNTPSVFQFDINSLEFLDLFQKVLNTEFAKLVAEEYEPNTGIYKALKQMWDSILEIIKNTLFPNKIQLKDATINSGVGTPIGEWAKLLADPRNEFLRNTEAYKKLQGTSLDDNQLLVMELEDFSASSNEENINLVEDPENNFILSSIENIEDIYNIFDLLDYNTQTSKIIAPLAQFSKDKLNDVLGDFVFGRDQEISKIKSFEAFLQSNGYSVQYIDKSDAFDTTNNYLGELRKLLEDFDRQFRVELERRMPEYVQLRFMLRHMYLVDIQTASQILEIYDLPINDLDSLINRVGLPTPIGTLGNFLRNSKLSMSIENSLDRFFNVSYPGSFYKFKYINTLLKEAGDNSLSLSERIPIISELKALRELLADDLLEKNFKNNSTENQYKLGLKAINDLLGKINITKSGSDKQFIILDLDDYGRNNPGSIIGEIENSNFEDFQNSNATLSNPRTYTFKMKDFVNYFKSIQNVQKIDFYATDLSKRSRKGEFDIVAKGNKVFTENDKVLKEVPDGERITIEFSTSIQTFQGRYGVDIRFSEKNSNFSTFINWEGQIFEMFNKLISNIFALHQDVPITFLTFTPMADSKKTQEVNQKTGEKVFNPDGSAKMVDKNIRKNLYNIMAAKAFAPYYVVSQDRGTTINLPLSKYFDSNVQRIKPTVEQLIQEDVDTINSTVKVKRSRAETLGNQSREIDREYERMIAEGKTKEQIFGDLFGRYSYESMRASRYTADFQSVYDEFVSNRAKESWSTYSGTWNKRKQGVIDFVDKYIIENSLVDIVSALRKGVRFIDVNNQLLAEGENASVVVEGMATPLEQNGDVVNFTDLEIYSALFEYGIPQNNLNQIFGLNYRKTINNLLLDQDFDTEIKQNLTEDARASKLTVSFSELNELSDQLGLMNSTAILNYINKHLSVEKGSPVIAAVKAVVDKINEGRSLGEVVDEFGVQIEQAGSENVQALAEIGTAAGRILRILRELNKNKADVIVDSIKQSKIKISPAFEQELRNAFGDLDKARNNFEEAKKNMIKDFTDLNAKELQRLEDALLDAEYRVAFLMSDPRLQFRFASEVLTNRAAMSLLGGQTAVLSAVANTEMLAAKYAFNQNLFKRFSEKIINLIKPDVFSRGGTKVFRLGKEEFRNRRLAFTLTHSRSVEQTKRAFLDGTIPNTAQAKFFENVAMVNSIRDAKNLVELYGRFTEAYKTKNKIDDMEFADIMQVMLYEHKESGKIILADNKDYSIMGAMVRALMQEQEMTSRLMSLGMDKYAANVVSKKALLDFVTMSTAMENSELPQGLIQELIRRGSMTNNGNLVPFVQDPNKPVFYLPGGNPETELVNLNILLAAIFRDEQVNPFDAEGARATFYADNPFVKNLRKARKGIRQGMISTYLNSLEAKAEGKTLKKYGYRAANAVLQVAYVAQWTLVPFPQIPSNILMQIVLRSNPLGAILNSTYLGFNYYKDLKQFYEKYKIGKYAELLADSPQDSSSAAMLPSQKTLPFGGTQSVVTTTDGVSIFDTEEIDTPATKDQILAAKKKMSTKEKIQFEKDLGKIFSDKRRFVTALADIGRSTEFLALVGGIAVTGAVLSSGDDDEKKRTAKKLGVNQNDFNVTYYLDYLKAKAFNTKLTPEEFYRKRGGFNYNSTVPVKDLPEGFTVKDGVVYDSFNQKVKTDYYMNITNLGTFFGYGLGYMSAVYAKQKKLTSTENDKTEGFKEYMDLGTLLTSVTGSVFRQTPSVKLVQDFLESLSDDAKKRGQGAQVGANMVASVLSVAAPSLFGKPRSQAAAETVQPSYEIEPSREDPNIGRLFLDASIKLSRNGILGLGLGQSEFYKSEIGLFGEDMSMRKTIAEPQSFMSYLEAAINFPALRKGTEVNVNKSADEILLHSQVRNFLINSSYLAETYGKYGGDANRYWGILDRPRKNNFIVTEGETNVLTGENPDKPFKLPNDIYRDELRILGDKMRESAFNYISGRTLEDTKDLVRGAKDAEEANRYIEQWFSDLNKTFVEVEAQYKKDFLKNRAPAILRTMKNRGLMTEPDMKVLEKLYDETNLKNILESELQATWEPVFDKKK